MSPHFGLIDPSNDLLIVFHFLEYFKRHKENKMSWSQDKLSCPLICGPEFKCIER